MDDDKVKKPVLNIDQQKDFNSTAASGGGPIAASGGVPITASDGLPPNKIKDYLKGIDFEKLMKNLPAKNKRHEETFINTIHLPPLDKSGSMGSILAHELPHVDTYKIYKDLNLLEKDYGKGFDKKIIIFDKMTDSGKKSISDYYNLLTATLDAHQTSQACGEALAESFQSGVAAPVQVRRPLSLRARVGATA